MRQGLDLVRRVKWRELPNEFVRGIFCVALLLVFWRSGLQITLVLLLPILVYAGLWMITSTPTTAIPERIPTSREIREAYANCLHLQEKIRAFSAEIADPKTLAIVQRVSVRIDQIMDVIAEDERYVLCLKLLEPLQITASFLSRYIRLIRRGHDVAEMKEIVRENLSALEQGFARFWEEFSQEAVIDLEAMGKGIDDWVRELPVPADISALPPELTENVANSHPPQIAHRIDSLTPREESILVILPTGKTDQEIGDMLFIAKRTVTSHLTSIYEKINVRNRAGAAAFAVRWGLSPEDEPDQERSARIT